MSHYTNNLFNPEAKNNSWVNLYAFVSTGSRVLDIGCSSGNFGDILVNEKKCEVIGLDIDNSDIQQAKKKLSAAYVRNIEREDISDLGLFDVIVFADVLEHLLDPVAALDKAKKQLMPGGRIVFSIPNMAHVSTRLQVMEGSFEYTPIGVLDRTHVHYYDEVEVKHIFAEAKLAIAAINPTVWVYPISLISDRLQKIGLSIQNKSRLEKNLETTKAYVWQFVGYAEVSDQKISSKRQLHYPMPPEELHATIVARDAELADLRQKANLLISENQRLREFYKNPIKGGVKRIIRRARSEFKTNQ